MPWHIYDNGKGVTCQLLLRVARENNVYWRFRTFELFGQMQYPCEIQVWVLGTSNKQPSLTLNAACVLFGGTWDYRYVNV